MNVTTPLPDAVCNCNLEKRQQDEEADARMYMRKVERLWHTPRCNVSLRMELRRTIEAIDNLDAVPHFPDPVLDQLHAQHRTDLEAKRDLLHKHLSANTRLGPDSWYDGTSQITGAPRPRKPTKESTT